MIYFIIITKPRPSTLIQDKLNKEERVTDSRHGLRKQIKLFPVLEICRFSKQTTFDFISVTLGKPTKCGIKTQGIIKFSVTDRGTSI